MYYIHEHTNTYIHTYIHTYVHAARNPENTAFEKGCKVTTGVCITSISIRTHAYIHTYVHAVRHPEKIAFERGVKSLPAYVLHR
jgi:hypothetical protein